MSETASRPPGRWRAVLGSVLEVALGGCLLAALGLSLTAGPRPETAQPGDFFRQPLTGRLARGEGAETLVPFAAVLVLVAVILLAQAALRVRPDVRGGTAGFAALLLLGPVLGYDGLVTALATPPEDAKILGLTAIDTFTPWLPVTLPLAVAAGLLVLWFVVVHREQWPPAAAGFTLVAGALPLLAVGLNLALIAARGNAGLLDYQQWPLGMAACFVIAQAGVAAAAAAAAARQPLGSRLVAASGALLLLVAVGLGVGR